MNHVVFRLETVWKSFGPNEVLKGISLKILEGETLAVMGQSGSGKTVLLKILLGFLRPDSGRVLFRCDAKGEKCEDLYSFSYQKMYAFRKSCGMVFQSGALFDSMTVYENLSLPLEEHTSFSEEEMRERIQECLSAVGLSGVERLHPAELSGGMQKRVALARALVMRPQIIFFDEPTSGLDPITADSVTHLILETKQKTPGMTAIVVTHDLVNALKCADQIALLYQGRIVELSPPPKFMQSPHPEVQKFLKTREVEV